MLATRVWGKADYLYPSIPGSDDVCIYGTMHQARIRIISAIRKQASSPAPV